MFEKLIWLSLFVFIAVVFFARGKRSMPESVYTYLALGGSHTIGEGVSLFETFPYQTVQLLRKSAYAFNAPEIVARSEWSADDLKKGMSTLLFQARYDFVSLLIGESAG